MYSQPPLRQRSPGPGAGKGERDVGCDQWLPTLYGDDGQSDLSYKGYSSYTGNSVGDHRRMWPLKDVFATEAKKLQEMKSSLSQDSAKVYRALELALQSHRTPGGPTFARDFHDNLTAMFPDAWDIDAKQIGGANQWKVEIDQRPAIFCSVRLEVLSEDQVLLREISEKAKLVKATLLEEDAKWKKALSSSSGSIYQKLAEFEEACSQRANTQGGGGGGGGCGGGGGGAGGNRWVVKGTLCQICGRNKEEDQLCGEHMCVVQATFRCSDCRYTWESRQARLQDNGELMGQRCQRCRGIGETEEWKLKDQGPPDWERSEVLGDGLLRPKQGHRSDLCEACIKFGSCMGIFHDPFILTTALSLLYGAVVQWESFSQATPELLVASIEGYINESKICLQPHVYDTGNPESPLLLNRPTTGLQRFEDDGTIDNDSEVMFGARPTAKGKGKGKRSIKGKGKGYRGFDDYDGYSEARSYDGADDFVELNPYTWPSSSRARRSDDDGDVFLGHGGGLGVREAGGVKDQAGMQSFLGASTMPMPMPMPQLSSSSSSGGAAFLGEDLFTRGKGGFGKSGGCAGKGGGAGPAEAAQGAAAAAAEVPRAKKANKIAEESGSSSSRRNKATQGAQASQATPMLDALPLLRRSLLLQAVQKNVKASGSAVDKTLVGEQYLGMHDGDFDRTFQYVAKLNESLAAA